MIDTEIRKRLQHAAWWMSAARLSSILLNMLLQIVLARVLAPADFGTFALLTSALSLTAIFGMLGMNEACVRFIAGEMAIGGARRAIRAAQMAFSFAAVAIPLASIVAAIVCTTFGDVIFGPSANQWIFALLLAHGGAALAAQQIGSDALRGLHELRWASLFAGGQSGGPLCVLIFVVLAIVASWGRTLPLETALLLHVVAISVVLPLTWSRILFVMRRSLATVDASTAEARSLSGEIFRMGMIMMGVHLLAFITQQADLWIGGQLLPREDLGLYHASRRMVVVIVIPIQVSMVTIASTIAELRARQEHDRLQKLLGKAAAAAGIPALGAFLVLALFAKPILGFVFGAYYQQATWPLVILICGYSVLALAGNPMHVLNVSGGHGASLWINAMSSAVLFVLAPWWAARFGLNGLAAASATSFALQNIAGWLAARRLLGVWTHASPRALLRANTND